MTIRLISRREQIGIDSVVLWCECMCVRRKEEEDERVFYHVVLLSSH